MDPRLLEYYNRELSYLRETGAEFAARHPKVAARLGMQGTDIADPYVERMVEAFSFLTARTQLKIDAEFPRFTQRLLEVVSPNYVTPTPSMSVAQLHPDREEGDLAKGFTVPRNTAFFSAIPEGESTACQFRSSQDVTLWPLAIEEARLTAAPPDMPALHRYLPASIHVAGALRITLRTFGELTFSQLAGLDRLPLYLCGEERTASHLFELLHTSAIATLAGVPGHFDGVLDVNLKQPVMYEGLEPDQGLLPLAWNVFHGHNLLHEYFACPERFYFFTPTGLSAGLQKIHGGVAEIVILLNRLPPDWLIHQINAAQFSLFCTPVVNLFPRVTARIDVTHSTTEQHLVVDRTHPLDYEVFSVQEVEGLATTLAHYFGVPFRIQEYVLHWIAVADDEITRLGIPAPSSVIGNGALIGQAVPDMQYKFRLVIGPLTLEDYRRFLPGGNNLPVLTELVRAFTGFEYCWEIELQLKPHAAPPAVTGGPYQLGWTAWAGKAMHDNPVTGMIFEPEHYLAH
ncbi:type VI secretion system baseplate subunit TssF [Salmonella enterica subsp. enterica serovar Dortmund]|nr:type VI secretion system baseplate subunit TssF [Salmonella enterica subsp. enterica serovar Dortmund]ECB1958519.1 type VI secretion system baseplate subunit TssF [Salmonella enterica subsp. enterica serovar Dortmund]MCB7131751.1 type VI secretion system baseplate subunit TssF [Salmonella enterica subsp. enterica serovar Hillegersberg]